MARLWQYQERAEPVLVSAAAETVTVDKWHPMSEVPVRRRSVIAAVSPALAFVSVSAIEAVAPAMAWHVPQPTPVRSIRRAINSGGILVEIVAAASETVTLDKWFQPASVPVRRPPWRPQFKGINCFDANGIRDPNLDDWEPRLPKNPVVRRPRVLGGGSVVVDFSVPVPPTVPELSWLPVLPQNPVRAKHRERPAGGFLVIIPTTPELSWAPLLPQNPVRAKHRQRPGETVLVEFQAPVVPVLSVFDWYVQQVMPVRRRGPTAAVVSTISYQYFDPNAGVFSPTKRIWKQPYRKNVWHPRL